MRNFSRGGAPLSTPFLSPPLSKTWAMHATGLERVVLFFGCPGEFAECRAAHTQQRPHVILFVHFLYFFSELYLTNLFRLINF